MTFLPEFIENYAFDKLVAYIFVGPRTDIQASYNANYQTKNFNEFYKSVWGLTYREGIEYRIKSTGILLEFEGYPEFTTINKDETAETSAGLKIAGQSYTFSSGIKYYISQQKN